MLSPSRRVPCNLTVSADLLSEAKGLCVNLSQTFEAALVEAVRVARQAAWLAENESAIRAFNDSVAEHGAFSRNRRTF